MRRWVATMGDMHFHAETPFDAISRKAIELGSRYDMAQFGHLSCASLRAAQASVDELDLVISYLKKSITIFEERKAKIGKDTRELLRDSLKSSGHEVSDMSAVQFDWQNMVVDILSEKQFLDLIKEAKK